MCPTLHNPMDCSTAGFPVLYCLLEFAQIHVHWISDAIQPCHPLLSTSPPDVNLSLFSPNRAACSLHYVYIVQGSARHLGIVSVQFSSVTQSCLTLCDPMNCSTPGLPVHHQLQEFTQTHVHWVGKAIQPSHPLSPLLLLPSIFPSIRVFSNESTLRIRWPKYWSFSFNISPSNEHPGLIFRMGWLDLLAVQGTLKSLLQHHSSKASILGCSAFFIVQLSHPYLTTGKTIALTRQTFVDKVMSLLFNMLSRLVITFLPRSKCLLISRLQSPSAMILEPRKIKTATVPTVSPSICHEMMGPDAMILAFWMLNFKPTFSLSSFSFISRLFSSSSLSAIRVVSSAYLRLLIFLSEILIPACAGILQPSVSHEVLWI